MIIQQNTIFTIQYNTIQYNTIHTIPRSVLVDQAGNIVARGHNMRVQAGDPTAHAEMVAIKWVYSRPRTGKLKSSD